MKSSTKKDYNKSRRNFIDSLVQKQVVDYYTINDTLGIPAMYVINYMDSGGYLILSAELKHEPILAYAESGNLHQNDVMPDGFSMWKNTTLENIYLIRNEQMDNTFPAKVGWIDLLNNYPDALNTLPDSAKSAINAFYKGDPNDPNDPCNKATKTTSLIDPLLYTKWGQWYSFNESCPAGNGCDHCPTGCPATALAQIIQYWAFPMNSYFNYHSMPLDSGNALVQELMYDIGNMTGTDYQCYGSGTSSANTNTFLHNFGYVNSIYSIMSPDQQLPLILANLSGGMPTILSGNTSPNSDGHMWVCDGCNLSYFECYNINLVFLHMNWGWNEHSKDKTSWVFWKPYRNSTYNFQYSNEIIYNITP